MATTNNADSRHGHRQRLRERYLRCGIESLADYEVIEMTLALCIPRIDVKPIAKDLIDRFENLRGILDTSPEELLKVKGIGENSLVALKLIKDLITIYHANQLQKSGNAVTTISKLIKFFKSKIAAEQVKVLEMLCFDAKLKIIGETSIRLVEGSVNSANVDIRKIIEIAIKRGATSIALAHNHPSGDPRPSLEDIRFTRKLATACKSISLNLIEHIIVSKNACFSFRRDGQFDCLYDESLSETRIGARGTAESLESLI